MTHYFFQTMTILTLLLPCATGNARIQILYLKDGRGVVRASGTPAFLTDSFCVTSTQGSVKLTFKNTGGMDVATRSWRAINVAGESLRYQQYVALAGDPVPTVVSDASSASIIVPSDKVAISPDACGAGNLLKGVAAIDPVPSRSPFIDTVTVTVTPL